MFAGVIVAILAQSVRTIAMITCGESFNHLIQTAKKDNHVLITHGMYVLFILLLQLIYRRVHCLLFVVAQSHACIYTGLTMTYTATAF